MQVEMFCIIFNPLPKFFTCLWYKSTENTVGKGEICSLQAISLLENFLPFSSSLKFSFANSFSLEGSKIGHLGKS